MSRSVHELLSTPSSSRRNLNATYIKSCTRNVIPGCISVSLKKSIMKRNSQLKEIGLLGQEWITYRLNALYGFSYRKLKRYEKILTSQIKNDIAQLEPDLQNKFQHIITKIQCFPDMVYSERDNPPIKITVEVEDESGCLVPHFVGFLLSVERKAGFMEQERNSVEAIILPLFLLNYVHEIFLKSVKYFLEDNFSCYVGHLKFSTYDLIFMLFLFSSAEDNEKIPTHIYYKGPSEEISAIRYAVDQDTLSEMWKQITAPFTEEISEDEVYEFLSILEENFYKKFSINLSYLDLQIIRTPLAEIQADYNVTVYETSKSYYVMRHLTHLAQELCQYK